MLLSNSPNAITVFSLAEREQLEITQGCRNQDSGKNGFRKYFHIGKKINQGIGNMEKNIHFQGRELTKPFIDQIYTL